MKTKNSLLEPYSDYSCSKVKKTPTWSESYQLKKEQKKVAASSINIVEGSQNRGTNSLSFDKPTREAFCVIFKKLHCL